MWKALVAAAAATLALAGDGRIQASSLTEQALASAVDIRAFGCRVEATRGAGAVIDGGWILTAAHVVTGADSITVRLAAGSEATPATAVVVALDPVHDLALLHAPDVDARQLPIGAAAEGDTGIAVVFRQGVAIAQPLTIDRLVIVRILDIFHEHKVSRPGFRVGIDIAPGDSGAVLVGPGGVAAGVLYATSREADHRAYASDTSAVAALLAEAEQTGGSPMTETRCVD